MIVLAFDTALGACSAGVWRDGRVLASEILAMPQGHSEVLMPMIERALAAAGVAYADLDRIAVTVGPGSFTGLRVGIAAARGLAMAAARPAIGVTTTDVLAAGVPDSDRITSDGTARRILAVVDSKRGDVFAQVFDAAGQACGEIVNVAYPSLADLCGPGPLVVVGDAAAHAIEALGARAICASGAHTCRVETIAALAARRPVESAGPTPVYVRPPDVTLSAGSGTLRP